MSTTLVVLSMDVAVHTVPDTGVQLECVREGGKLRVRITTPGYNPNANCQFPRDIRKEGAKYTAPSRAITFSRGGRGTFFYRVKKSLITVIPTLTKPEKIYGLEDDETECAVCYEEERFFIFIPCGHYCLCAKCYKNLPTPRVCPMCRAVINEAIDKNAI